ncbi:MAG: tRNA threonylcarbamoyladenosine dehydratase [Clostridia bacterium]|nr:tRNA threonylcarbamoyladenosine dehydratase [Clostridia bacterium]
MQFSRNELIIGKEAQKKLFDSSVIIFGLGGVGGYVCEALARAGIGRLDIVDNDTINVTNINRQIIACHSTIGMKKTDAFENRIKDINPSCIVTKHDVFYLPEVSCKFDFASYDYAVDAIDTVTAKLDLAVKCYESGTRLISSMGTGNKLDPTALRVADIYDTKVCPLARVMRSELKKRNIPSLKVVYSEEVPISPRVEASAEHLKSNPEGKRAVPGSCSFVPPVAGLIIASEVIKDIIGRNV